MGSFGSRSRGPLTGQVYLVEPRRFVIGDRLSQNCGERGRLVLHVYIVFSHMNG